MPADIMTLEEFQNASSHWSQRRKGHKHLIKIDNALSSYHAIAKNKIEQRISSLKQVMDIAKEYADAKKLFVWQDTRRKRKIGAAEAVYNQAVVKIKYLKEALLAEKRLPAMFGSGNKTPLQKANSAMGRWAATIKQIRGLQQYIGKPDDGRQLHEHYWREAIDPLHTNWKNPNNNQVFREWKKARYEDNSTMLSFYRWLETQSDEDISRLTRNVGLLPTTYLDEEGREQYRLFFQNRLIKYLKSPAEMLPWGSESNSTNFCGKGWAIFVMSPEGKLYAATHNTATGWFHASFLGGKPVKAAGEIYVKNGIPLVITDKSGHYKPQFTNLCDAVREMNRNGIDISQLQIWSRWTDPHSGKIFTGDDGMRASGIWYMAIDAERYINTGNRNYAMIFDFAIKSGSSGKIKTATPQRLNMSDEQQKEYDEYPIMEVANRGKNHFRGCSIDQYCKAPHVFRF
ncbi:hypothetical protein [Thalassomonas actiniarum]|uniref:Uncharacterized protein n=1 Tax=Thalassomonas actiniarum TaxID=485447 RepID=A0AAE9YUQ6_9GAMM|nr:hypothetical protein [Thalassomonas actiniarum]WDE00784.1 hypothetical protein SG35_009195 [Thalassomonas actiniarum]